MPNLKTTQVNTSKPSSYIAKDYLVNLRDFALAKGVSAKVLLSGTDLSYQQFLELPELVPEIYYRLIGNNVFESFTDPWVKVVELAHDMKLRIHGNPAIAAQGASDLYEALQIMQAFYKTRANAHTIEIFPGEKELAVRFITTNKERNHYLFLACLMGYVNTIHSLQPLTKAAPPFKMHVKNSEPQDFPWSLINDFELSFAMPHDEIVIPKEIINLPLPKIDPEFSQAAIDQLNTFMEEAFPGNIIEEVKKVLKESSDSDISIQEVATLLNHSVSTLQRRLKEYSTTFREVKQQHTEHMAKHFLLDTKISIERISSRLGFSDVSAFSKSFRRSTGQTPAAFRKSGGRQLNGN